MLKCTKERLEIVSQIFYGFGGYEKCFDALASEEMAEESVSASFAHTGGDNKIHKTFFTTLMPLS